jgi:hypothetical protein
MFTLFNGSKLHRDRVLSSWDNQTKWPIGRDENEVILESNWTVSINTISILLFSLILIIDKQFWSPFLPEIQRNDS